MDACSIRYFNLAFIMDYRKKLRKVGEKMKMKRALFDFNIGYFTTVFLGLCFMALGAFVMFYSDEEISGNANSFAKQLIFLYNF